VTPTELAGCCPFVDEVYAVEYTDFLHGAGDPEAALVAIPRDWDYASTTRAPSRTPSSSSPGCGATTTRRACIFARGSRMDLPDASRPRTRRTGSCAWYCRRGASSPLR